MGDRGDTAKEKLLCLQNVLRISYSSLFINKLAWPHVTAFSSTIILWAASSTWINYRNPNHHKLISSSSSYPVLRLVKGVTKLNPSISSKAFLNFFSLLVGTLESFLGSCQSSSCQHALTNCSYTDIWILFLESN
jgi:hypothetical protein